MSTHYVTAAPSVGSPFEFRCDCNPGGLLGVRLYFVWDGSRFRPLTAPLGEEHLAGAIADALMLAPAKWAKQLWVQLNSFEPEPERIKRVTEAQPAAFSFAPSAP